MNNKQLIEMPKSVLAILEQTDKDLKQAVAEFERVDRIIQGLNLYKQAVISNYVKQANLEDLDIRVLDDYTLEVETAQMTDDKEAEQCH